MSPPVSFLVAGVQKGGTTALFEYLRRHPELQLADCKEVHFFDDEGQDWSRPDYDGYHSLFDPAGPRLWGEATPVYIYWPQSLERIARYNPAMRLILSFRDARARAWSHWRMEVRRGWETEPFPWCIREGRARVANDPQTPGHHRVYSYIERGFYGAQLRRVLDLFPREQVLCLRAEDLKAEPRRVLDQLCAFLGVSPLPELTPVEANVGEGEAASPTAEDMALMTELLAAEMRLFSTLSGLELGDWER